MSETTGPLRTNPKLCPHDFEVLKAFSGVWTSTALGSGAAWNVSCKDLQRWGYLEIDDYGVLVLTLKGASVLAEHMYEERIKHEHS